MMGLWDFAVVIIEFIRIVPAGMTDKKDTTASKRDIFYKIDKVASGSPTSLRISESCLHLSSKC